MKLTILNNEIGGELKEISTNIVTQPLWVNDRICVLICQLVIWLGHSLCFCWKQITGKERTIISSVDSFLNTHIIFSSILFISVLPILLFAMSITTVILMEQWMGFLLSRRTYITEKIGRGYFSLFLLCMVCTWGAYMVVGVHTHVYASGGESNVGCLPLPPLDCLRTHH